MTGTVQHYDSLQSRLPRTVFVFLLLVPVQTAPAAGPDLRSEVQLLLKSPDATISGTYDLPARVSTINSLAAAPILVARLWEAYDFSPRYKIRMQGEVIHVEDPTGIQGDVFTIEQAADRRVYYGNGALNHNLVPAFGGTMAIVLQMTPKDSGTSMRVDVYIRTESRVLGLLARTLFPLVRTRAEYRIATNMNYLRTILNDLSTSPSQAASHLKNHEDAVALLRLLSPGFTAGGRSRP